MSKQYGPDRLSTINGIVAISGCVIAAACDLAGMALSDRLNIMRHTISNLAAGPWDWLADLGIYAFVVSVIAVALGLLRWRIERLDWRIGTVLLVVLAVDVTLIAAYEAYARPDGPVLHYYFVYVLGVAFPLVVLLTAGQIYEIGRSAGIALYALGVIWAIAAPFLFLVPTAWDGLYERALALGMLAWFVTMGAIIWRDPDVVRAIPKDERT